MKTISISLFISIIFIAQLNAQIDSISINTLQKKSFIKKSIVPLSFIAGGAILSGTKFEKTIQRNIRNTVGNDFGFAIDDYARYAPIATLYAADILGVKAKNHWFDQTKNLTLAIIISDFITYKLKKGLNKPRPNGSLSFESMPSGHTSFAFTNAAVLYNEFKDTSPIIAYSGYVFATTTGVFRTLNNAHYVSDVLVGAGIGILVTELIYHFDPIIKWNPFKKNDNIVFVPQVHQKKIGFYLSANF
jgi:membrane-associated phospholipid phosphatase